MANAKDKEIKELKASLTRLEEENAGLKKAMDGSSDNEKLILAEEKIAELEAQLEGATGETLQEADVISKEDHKKAVAGFEKRIAELEQELKTVKKSKVKVVDSKLITDRKQLDPKKNYVSGPNGIGYIEVK